MLVGQACFRWDQLIQMESQTHFLSCAVSCTPLHSPFANVKYKIQKYRRREANTKSADTNGVPCFPCRSMPYNVQFTSLYNDARNPKHSIIIHKCWKYDNLTIKVPHFDGNKSLDSVYSVAHMAAAGRICKPRDFMLKFTVITANAAAWPTATRCVSDKRRQRFTFAFTGPVKVFS